MNARRCLICGEVRGWHCSKTCGEPFCQRWLQYESECKHHGREVHPRRLCAVCHREIPFGVDRRQITCSDWCRRLRTADQALRYYHAQRERERA